MARIATISLAALLLAACSGREGGGGATDAGTDAGADGGADEECTDDVWVDTFDEAECPEMSGWDDCVVYVRTDGSPSGDGKTWATATNDIQDAVNTARCGVIGTDLCAVWQVWIAEGTYYVFEKCNSNTVYLRSDVAMYGGFDGTETSLEQRDPVANETMLNGADAPASMNHVVTILNAYDIEVSTLDGFTITGGYSNDYGGGGLMAYQSEIAIRNCSFRENFANRGGAAYVYGSSISLSGCSFSANISAWGGGLRFEATTATVESSTFDGNTAMGEAGSVGGAISCTASSMVNIIDCDFAGNSAQHGGALHSWESFVEISGSDFAGNSVDVQGGAIEALFGVMSVSGCTFTESEALGWGGAITLLYGEIEVQDSSFEDNYSGGYGGAIILNSFSSGIVANSTFVGNEAAFGGGGVAGMVGSLVIENCLFEANAADPTLGAGGGVLIQADPLQMTGNDFLENTANQGGGVCLWASPTGSEISNNVFARNAAVLGAGVLLSGGSSTATGCTFHGNAATAAGGAVYVWTGSFELDSSILWDNPPYELGWIDLETPPVVAYSDVMGSFPGEGNIDADPLFADAVGDDFHLQAGSPCIDAANGETAPETDKDGNARVDDPDSPNTGLGPPWADMGAFEFQVAE